MKSTVKKSIGKCIKLMKLTAVVATVAMTVYTLIPKSDKITGINTDSFEKRARENEEALNAELATIQSEALTA